MRTFKALLFASMVFVGVHAASGEAAEITKDQCDALKEANRQQMAVIIAFTDALRKKYEEELDNLANNIRKTDISELNKVMNERSEYLEDFSKAAKIGNPETMKKARLIIDMVCKE